MYIQEYFISDISDRLKNELETIFDQSYHNSHMFEGFLGDIKEQHEVFHLLLAYEDKTLIGVILLEDIYNSSNIKYFEEACIHIKRFTVHPSYRGKGIGNRLLQEAQRVAFLYYGFSVIFGESNEIGALRLYGKQGALYNKLSIENISVRNSAEENMYFFKELLSIKSFTKYRYPSGGGINFVFYKDEKNKKLWESRGYVAFNDL